MNFSKKINQLRRSLKVSTSDGSVTGEFIIGLMKDQKYKCAISGECIRDDYHIDHIIPLNKVGENSKKAVEVATKGNWK